jgi:hypothetical protein
VNKTFARISFRHERCISGYEEVAMKNDDVPKERVPLTTWLVVLFALVAVVLTIWGFATAGSA